MSGFEGARVGPVTQVVREWRLGRFVPLYAAGILAGIGLGVGIATWPAESTSTNTHIAIPGAVSQSVVDAPVIGAPLEISTGVNPPLRVELPADFNALFAGAYLPIPSEPATVPALVETAPAQPASPSVAAAPAQAAQPAAVVPVAPAAAAAPPAAAAPAKPNFYVPEVSSGPATAMELTLFNLMNAERAKEGLPAYVLDPGLTKIARTRTQQLVDQNYFAHTDPYGYSMYVELLAHFGYTSYAWAGENLAMNNWPAETAGDEAIRGLMASPTHRANIMTTDFTRVGVGEVTVPDGRHFYAMIFLG
jgi:uncharacterized protein YkwD